MKTTKTTFYLPVLESIDTRIPKAMREMKKRGKAGKQTDTWTHKQARR